MRRLMGVERVPIVLISLLFFSLRVSRTVMGRYTHSPGPDRRLPLLQLDPLDDSIPPTDADLQGFVQAPDYLLGERNALEKGRDRMEAALIKADTSEHWTINCSAWTCGSTRNS
jgi:hypothetical protein